MKPLILLLCMALVLSGCAAPMPPEPSATEDTSLEDLQLAQLEADLIALTQKPRPLGSSGEADAADYLRQRLEALGYPVTLQEFVSPEGALGHNVVASKPGSADGDILVISAHHDSFPTSFGANDNGSGLAALLLAAQELSSLDTDTELRFLSFTGEETGKNGSRYYVSSLSEEERQRIIGCIQLDMLGGLGGGPSILSTTDGEDNWLSQCLGQQLPCSRPSANAASDHASFQLAGIPAVLVTQKEQGYLYHSAGDTWQQLDLSAIREAALAVARTAAQIASPETPSYREPARENPGTPFYRQSRSSRIFFSSTRQENEGWLGISGTLVEQWEEHGEGWTDFYEVYAYQMAWFGLDDPMTTHYRYRNGYLEHVEIHPAENAVSEDMLVQQIIATHGQPTSVTETSRCWEDSLYGKYLSLEPGPVVFLYPYSLGISNTLASYPVTDGETQTEDPQHQKVWDLLCRALPSQARQAIGQFQLFTDGFGNILAYTAPIEGPQGTDNTRFSVTLDYYDVFDENGNIRDESKILQTIVHEYGHVLLENDTQIDLTQGQNIHDPAGFVPGSFRQRYYDAFWRDSYSSFLGSYQKAPENYVSSYSGNAFHEDIADTFAVFVFGGQPQGDSVAAQKLRFFWEEASMVALRAEIRQGLGLS